MLLFLIDVFAFCAFISINEDGEKVAPFKLQYMKFPFEVSFKELKLLSKHLTL